MITKAHSTITSCCLPLNGLRWRGAGGQGTALTNLLWSWLRLLTTTGDDIVGVLPLQGAGVLVCGNFLWFVDVVSFNLALSFPSVKLIVLVWKSAAALFSFLVMLLTKCILLTGAGVARGGGTGASDMSTNFFVDIIG